MPKLYIAVFRPEEGNYLHWALGLQGATSKILEVSGSHPDFTPHTYEATWEDDPRHMESIQVGDVTERDLDQFFEIVSRTPVDNDTVEWNCQDYVLEALDELAQECVIDEDESYAKGVKRAKRKYFGPRL